jgi:TolA-binding protein
VTYPQTFVREAISAHAIPVQVDNSKPENQQFLHSIHHIWTPDVRICHYDGFELYRWDGYLPPSEYAARLGCAYGMAFLRLKRYDDAEQCYVDVLRRFSTSYAAPEAEYYLGVTRYRRDPESDELLTEWANLASRYPMSEYRVKQSFKELPEIAPG